MEEKEGDKKRSDGTRRGNLGPRTSIASVVPERRKTGVKYVRNRKLEMDPTFLKRDFLV